MENLTHSLVGAVLSRAGLEQKTVLATPALLLAVNLPDIDILGSAIGQNYLDFHRGITHSLAAVPVLSAALAATLWAGSRMFVRDPVKRVRFLPMLGICLIGVLSNPALDMLNDYGSRPFLPFSSRKVYGDLLSIADFWLWIVFGGALFAPPLTRACSIATITLTLIAGSIVFLAGGAILAIAWLAVLGVALAVSSLLRRRGVNPARVALAVTLIYLGGLYLARERVLDCARDAAPALVAGPVTQIDVLPAPPGEFGRWTVILQAAETYYIGEAGLGSWHINRPAFEVYRKNLDEPAYRKSLVQSQMAAMARFARFPCVRVERSATSCSVLLSDLRWARRNRDGWGAARAEIPLGDAGPPSP